MSEPKEWWIKPGSCNFGSSLEYDYKSDDPEQMKKNSGDGFYHLISELDTIEDGIHVIEKSAYDALKQKLDEAMELIEWLSCGIEHFIHEEDQGQVQHLQNRIAQWRKEREG